MPAEPVYRVCYECGREWAAGDLIDAHNAIVAEVNADAGENVATPVTSEAQVHCCPECIHDW